jgi:multiple sugar transport system substrate-binding protein
VRAEDWTKADAVLARAPDKPWSLSGASQDIVFTPAMQIHLTSSSTIRRSAGSGDWRSSSAIQSIVSGNQEIDFTSTARRSGSGPQRHRGWAGVAAGLAAVLLALGPAHAQEAATTVLRIASFPDLDRGVRGALAAFRERHPQVQVRLTSLGVTDHHTAMTTALATGANVPDLMAIDVDYIGRLSRSAGLHDLAASPFGAAAFQGRLASYALAAAQPQPGRQTALPVDVGPGALFYRADLMQRAGIGEAELTQSWPSFIEAGRRLKQATGAYLVAHAADLAYIGIRSGLAPGDGVYFDAQGRSLVQTPRFVRAFEVARAAREAGIDGRMRAWTNEWAEGLRGGRVATQMMGSWLGGHLKNWIAPESAGRWRAAQLPGGAYAAWGGSYYAIPKAARQPALAWEFLQLLALDRAQQLAAFESFNAFPALLDAQADAVMDVPQPYFAGQPARQLWRSASARIAPTASDRFDPIAYLIVQGELMQVLDQGKPVAQALADASRTIERRVRRR